MKTISKEFARKVRVYGYYDDAEYRYFRIIVKRSGGSFQLESAN